MSVDEAVERAIVPAEKGEIVDTTLENYATQIAECETETEIIKCVESIDSAITKEVRKISWEDYDADGNQLLASTGIGLGAFCKYGAAALYWLATEFPDFSAPGVLPLGLAVLGIHLAFDAGLISLAWNYFGEKEKLFEQDKKERIAEVKSKRLLLASAIETMYDRECAPGDFALYQHDRVIRVGLVLEDEIEEYLVQYGKASERNAHAVRKENVLYKLKENGTKIEDGQAALITLDGELIQMGLVMTGKTSLRIGHFNEEFVMDTFYRHAEFEDKYTLTRLLPVKKEDTERESNPTYRTTGQ